MNGFLVAMSAFIVAMNGLLAAMSARVVAMNALLAAMNARVVAMNALLAAMNARVVAMNALLAAMSARVVAMNALLAAMSASRLARAGLRRGVNRVFFAPRQPLFSRKKRGSYGDRMENAPRRPSPDPLKSYGLHTDLPLDWRDGVVTEG